MRSGGKKSWTARTGFALILVAAAISAKAQAGGAIPLEIGHAQELAAKGSDEVRARDAAAEAAMRAVDAARANFFPKLSASVSGMYLVNPPKGVTVDAGSLGNLPLWVPATATPSQPYSGPFIQYPISLPSENWAVVKDAKSTYFKGALTFTQPLVTWGKIRAAVDLASLEAKVAAIGSRGASLDAQRSVNRAYFSALLSREGAGILGELRAMAASILEDRKSAMDEGFATMEGVLSSTADLAALDTRIVQAREGEASAMEALGLLTGLDSGAILLVSPFRTSLPPLSEPDLRDQSLASSTDVDLSRARLSQARRKLDLERGSSLFLPDVALFASLDVAGQDIPYAVSAWTDTWNWDISIGINVKADFFDGGASQARRREASSSLEAARIAAGATEKAARLQARRAVDAARGAEAALREKEARAAWAAESLRVASAKAADQAIPRAELNASAIGEATARLDLLYALYALEQAIADLERLAGRRMGAEEPR